ncbi:ArgS-related anticodon-binding protein NrtL [Actinacidiphila oryziradicis]|uniref:ArgS-related anticodon-binding protein NrtL n=1 Tax=Actinacidiphila oryziradicis TaxID=2571141 RepID=UPI0023F0894B|nr:DALR anticodon-binding domain-containing protein [Actinacidiphila oryziradicis]
MTPAELSRTVLRTVRHAVEAEELSVAVPERIVVQRPPRPGCGDYATNVALQLAGPACRPPRQVAEILRERLVAAPGIARVEIAEPGFLNITLDTASYGDAVRGVLRRGEEYGHGDGLRKVRATVVHDGEPREAAIAEAANRLLRACGARVGAPQVAPQGAPAPESAPERVNAHPAGVTREELLRTLGEDATQWALLRPPAEDAPQLDAAARAALLMQRAANPLFRVRYAYARTRALLRNAHDLGIEAITTTTTGDDAEYTHPAETDLLGLIADFPRVVEAAARRRAPDRVARHLERTADAFFRFHDECPALPRGDEQDEKPSAVHRSRLRLAEAAGTVLANGLTLLGISAPAHL